MTAETINKKKKHKPLKLDMSFEEAIRRSIKTKIPKKKNVRHEKK
jgi:hypothetical protein